MSATVTLATAMRVLAQLRRDPRTIALLIVVPALLLVILRFVFDGQTSTFNRVAPPLLGLIPFIAMFIVTSVAMLRERVSGTLERLMSTPMAKLDLLLGYAIAFGATAIVQVGVASALTLGPLGADAERPLALLGLSVLAALLGMALGLFLSAFATSEFQAVQFMPAFVLPQLLVCGLFVPRESMAQWLEWLAWFFPLTYVYDALERVSETGALAGRFWIDVAVMLAVLAAALLLGAATLRRRTT